MALEELFLFDLKTSEFKSVDIRGYNNDQIAKLPVCKGLHSDDFNQYDLFHLININKVTERKDDIEKFLKEEFHLFKELTAMYKESLPIFNQELLEKYNDHAISDADCIIVPESSNDWLREGLADLFSQTLNLPIYEAKKSHNIKFSENGDLPIDFRFILDFDKPDVKNIILIIMTLVS